VSASTVLAEALELRRRQCGTIDVSLVMGARAYDDALVASTRADGVEVEVLDARPMADEPLAVALNRSGSTARGRALLLVLAGLDGPADADADADAAGQCLARLRDPAVGLWQVNSVVAVACGVWVALDGLDVAYRDIWWSIADLHRRVRALGYGAGSEPPIVTRPQRTRSRRSDTELYDRRWGPARQPARVPTGQRRAADRGLVIYTAISDCYDTLKRQSAAATVGARQVAFVDDETRRAVRPAGWQLESIGSRGTDANRTAKYPKVLAHRVLPEAGASLWMDASVLLIAPFGMQRLVELFLAEADLCVFEHDRRRCVYEEARHCIALGLDEPATIEGQMARYREDGFPPDAGLAEATVILRRHTPRIEAFNERWWREIQGGSRRDQLSFPYVARKLGLPYQRFPLSLGTRNGLFMKITRPTGTDG
jgi:hypothetical protein